MKIEQGSTVEVEYTVYDSEGAEVESSEDEPVEFVQGEGEILPGLEKAMVGHVEGDEFRVTLAPDDAFGDHSPDGIVSIPRDRLPEDSDLKPGDYITLMTEPEEGEEHTESDEFELRIVETSAEEVIADANHPLAGQEVTFEVKVLAVRPPSA